MSRLRYLDPRASFGAKLVAAFLVTVGIILAVALIVVRNETAGQVELVSERAVERARQVFSDYEQGRREALARRAGVFTDTRRTAALVEAAIEAGDTAFLADQISYALQLTQFDSSSLTVLTEPEGQPLLTFLGETPLMGSDPAGIEALVGKMLASARSEMIAYRRVDDRLYTVRTVILQLGGRPIGTVTFGLPIVHEDAADIARVIELGAELCFVAGGECVAGTELARRELAPLMVELAGTETNVMREREGERWELITQPLVVGTPDVGLDPDLATTEAAATNAAAEAQGWLVMAVPLEGILSPFDRIRRALALAGLGALLLAVLVSVALSRSLIRPIQGLVAATRRVARGDYDARVPETSDDEMGHLARSFNVMTEELALKERYRGVLDKVVSRDVAEELLRGDLTLGGETREVTVLFADIRGFTAITERMAPETVIGLLNETMERLGHAVEEEGGVVDKYVGDEIMAVFGAPMDQPDHASRAVRAGQAMQRAMREVNARRAARGEPVIGIGIGIHTGEAVAGNMGSTNRLNYTVVGAAVNLAARLCSAAAPGEILISEAVRDRVDDVASRARDPIPLKGFSESVPVFDVSQAAGGGSPSMSAVTRCLVLLGLGLGALAGTAAVGLATPRAAAAQSLPTLRDLGVGYISPTGQVQLDLSGRLDLEAYAPGDEPAWIIPSIESFVAPRARLFADLFLGSRVYLSGELRADRSEEPAAGDMEVRVDQAFARVGPVAGLWLQAGKFVSPFGGYPQRHHTVKDPFIRPPLSYDYRTMICPGIAPATAAGFASWKDEPELFRPSGAPPIWGAPYQWGGMVLGAAGPVSFRAGAMNSAPSSEPEQWEWDVDRMKHPSWVANVGVQVSPALRLEASYDRGPYLTTPLVGSLPAGAEPHDYVQEIYGAEMVLARGGTVLRGEFFADRWEVPNVDDDAWDYSYYVEAQTDVATGLYVAARYGAIRFNELDDLSGGTTGYGPSLGDLARWDYDTRRIQLAAGYRVFRNAGIVAEYMLNHTDTPLGDPADNLLSLQLWWSY